MIPKTVNIFFLKSFNLKISIIGYGKMGKEIEITAKQREIEVVSVIDPLIEIVAPGYTYKSISEESIKNAEVCIDFTTPNAVIHNIRKLAELRKNVVVGTTGWYENIDLVKEIVESSRIGLIYSPNFSIGVNIFFRIVRFASKNLSGESSYDIYGQEIHHKEKKDSPSGTAKTLEKIIKEETGRYISFSNIRAGYVTGTHIVCFDSEWDSIELRHAAKNRKGFAHGALIAAEFIRNKEGLYNGEDFINYLASRK
ncbi:MAG: 4-hydroxy-tetrahydrodipicolinate reductase [Planctomycetota bacterium]